jgi:DNA polymerase-3 subunit gamma/tau
MAKRKAPAPPAESPTAGPIDTPSNKAAETYTVLARRYRPQQFSDLVGQEPVARALVNALQSNRVAHAYLFTGARGVGKTSTARILAKALNCERGPTTTPCGTCDICQSIAAGEDVDVIEIDGASNRRIDEVREIRQNVQYRPSRARFKIYIIDEVHQLTKEAFNALLKTLEEPPAHVKFIFATTEVEKIPITILSRCQRFDFAGIGTQRIVERLRLIVSQEGMQADDEALALVARRAGGSMRDAQSLLDQLLAFGGERLTTDQVHRLLGTARDERVFALAAAILEHDAKKALELLGQAADEGLQLGEFLDQLIEYWRDLMIVRCAGAEGAHLSAAPEHRATLGQQAARLSLDTILAGLDILAQTKARMRGSSHGRVLLEMALVRLGRLDDLVALSQLAQWLAQPNGSVPAGRPAAPAAPSPATGRRVGNSTAAPAVRGREGGGGEPEKGSDPLNLGGQTPFPVQPPEVKKKSLTEGQPPPAGTGPVPSAQALPQIWQEVLTQVGPLLANDLEKAGLPAISGPNTLVLRFPSRYNLPQEHCQNPTALTRIEEALKKAAGRVWHLRIESTAGATSGASREAATEESANPHSVSRRQRQEALQQPLVQRVMEVLGAQVLDMEEGFGSAPPGITDPTAMEQTEEG